MDLEEDEREQFERLRDEHVTAIRMLNEKDDEIARLRRAARLTIAWAKGHPGELPIAFVPLLANLNVLCAESASGDSQEKG